MIRTLLLLATLTLTSGCTSGLKGGKNKSAANAAVPSTNLRFGFDPGMVLTDPFTGTDIAGGTLPGVGGGARRPVAFLAFVTKARADDGDGTGKALDRSTVPPGDVAGTADVFLAAVAADVIDTRAFVYSIAGKLRHPRCVTCHSMNVTPTSATLGGDTTAFATAEHRGGNLPVGIAANCADCHEVEDWRAPPEGLDLRGLPASQLFVRSKQAINGPNGPGLHFEDDPRVLWALGSNGGRLPFGNVADDDHDGVAEAEDRDGIARTVPGGVSGFLKQLEDWKQSGMKFDSSDSVQDVVLASRAFGANLAGNGDSSAPSVHYRENPGFVVGVSNPDVVPVGFVRVAYASDATNLAGGATNGATDVFLTDVNVFHRSNGAIDLVVDPASLALVSKGIGGEADGDSTDPDLGGVNGERVAFVSTATNLVTGFGNANLGETDVYVAEPGLGLMQLVSHVPTDPAIGGDGRSTGARLDATGSVVVFESASTDLVNGDTNGARDVFFATLPGLVVQRASVASGGTQATGGDSFDPSVFVFPGTTDVRIAFSSAATSLVADARPGLQNVYLFDSRGVGTTILLNRIVGPARQTQPPVPPTPPGQPVSQPSASRNAGRAVIGPDGLTVLFESLAGDIDFVRPGDDNRVMDVMLADLRLLERDGFVLPYALSVTSSGGESNGASSMPRIASLIPVDDGFPLGVAVFSTTSTNLSNPDVTGDANNDGVPDSDNLVMMFLREGATVIADFETTPETQGVGQDVQFESTSSGNPTVFQWDFGDGSTSNEKAPLHAYATPGTYTVKLTVDGALGRDDREREVRVLAASDAMFVTTKDSTLSGVTQDPAVSIPNGTTIRGAVDPNVVSSLRFVFDSASSTGSPNQFEWLLGPIDPISGLPTATPASIAAVNAPIAETTLSARGTFEVSLTSTGLGGAGTVAKQRIEVWNRVLSSFNPVTAVSGDAPLNVSFQATSQGDVGTLNWRRDGTGFSTVPNPTETFPEGVFQVDLVTNGLGGDTSVSTPVTITSFGALTASFTPTTISEIRNTTRNVTFVNQSKGTIALSYFWDLGNGSTSTAATPSTSYTVSTENVRVYNVRLVASTDPVAPTNCLGQNPNNCKETSGVFTFYPPINSNVTVSASATQPRQITMTPSVTGDGTGTNPTYTFLRSSPGGFTPNITLGTFNNASARTFTVSTLGVYRFALRVTTNAPNAGTQTDTSSSKVQEVFADFDTDVFPIIQASCVSCHTSAANCATNGELSYGLSPSAAKVYNTIVDVNAKKCTGSCGGQPTKLINSNSTDPNQSWFYKKLSNQAGSCGGVMPPGTSGLSSGNQSIFRSWIRGGAVF